MDRLFVELSAPEASTVAGGGKSPFLGYTNKYGSNGNPLTDANAAAYAVGNDSQPNGSTTALTYTSTQAYDTTGVQSTSLSHTYINYHN
jgi:hypothetical protein